MKGVESNNQMTECELITLVFLTDKGLEERMRFDGGSMFEARHVAERVLHAGAGLYTHVEIHAASRIVEKIDRRALELSRCEPSSADFAPALLAIKWS
jgi:hypothetical protein